MSTANNLATKRIVHLGLGAFHRAHQAVYLQRLQELGQHDWELCSGNLRDDMPDVIAALLEQNGRYTLETVDPTGQREYLQVTALRQIVAYQPGVAPLVALASDKKCQIISFTVTEAGYYLDGEDELDCDAHDLAADLVRVRVGEMGQTIYGAISFILAQRRKNNSGAVTLLCCDNVRHNGDKFAKGLRQFIAALGDQALQEWALAHISCPNSMVDRITPRPQAAVNERVKAAIGVEDKAAVMAESFIQWVIEDKFIAARPPLELVGVEIVKDVTPYEEAKIRLLNATHSCVAWAGSLKGYRYIHEGVQDTLVRQWAYDYVTQDVLPCLVGSPINLPQYRDTVLQRFSNPAIEDTNQRVAMDGFSKIPGFILPTIREALRGGRSINAVALLPALFLCFLQRWHRGELGYEYVDQAMEKAVAHAIIASDDAVQAFSQLGVLWQELAGDTRLLSALRQADKTIRHALHLT